MQTKDQKRRGVLRRMAHQTRLTIPADKLRQVANEGNEFEVWELVVEAEATRQRRETA